jgi:hypothetical protein
MNKKLLNLIELLPSTPDELEIMNIICTTPKNKYKLVKIDNKYCWQEIVKFFE